MGPCRAEQAASGIADSIAWIAIFRIYPRAHLLSTFSASFHDPTCNISYLCLIPSWIQNNGSCYHNPFDLHMKVFNINLRVSYNVIKLQQKKSNNNLSILQLLVLCSLLVIVSNFRGTSTSSIITSKFVLHGEREKSFISMYFQLVEFDQILFLYHTHCKI